MRFSHRLAILLAPMALAVGPVPAQQSEMVQFAPGTDATTLNGEITGQGFADYTLGASTGQEMSVALAVDETDGDGTIYFNVMAPDAEPEALYIGSMDDDNAETMALPLDGTYTIRVYLMGNDADADKTVSYTLELAVR